MPHESTTLYKLLSPIMPLLRSNPYTRKCESLTDYDWVKMGIRRVIGESNSGRSFLQMITACGEKTIWTSHYFDTLKSHRRLDHLKYLNNTLIRSEVAWEDCEDPVAASCPELDDFNIQIGDGHHHKAPVHEIKVGDKVYSTQHFYAKALRSGLLWHLTLAEYGDTRKKEHDMRALKRQNIETLRAGSAKGIKTLWLWDRACIDFAQWHQWKMKGIYFLTMEKELNEFKVLSNYDVDTEDPINAGVIKDEKVESASKKMVLRRVTYRCPETGNTYSFLTNLPKKIRPGVVAFLYKCRWGIEKNYNTFKHKFGEQRAWAVSPEAKEAQANFICLTHNLALILNRKVERESPEPELSPNHSAREKKKKRVNYLEEKCRKRKIPVSTLLLMPTRLAEMPKKFIIWLRESIRIPCSWNLAISRLELCCARKY
jgi:hypothetical protein